MFHPHIVSRRPTTFFSAHSKLKPPDSNADEPLARNSSTSPDKSSNCHADLIELIARLPQLAHTHPFLIGPILRFVINEQAQEPESAVAGVGHEPTQARKPAWGWRKRQH